ncbi:MAG: PQQ-dependent sugar dehydrogenase [bacterium]
MPKWKIVLISLTGLAVVGGMFAYYLWETGDFDLYVAMFKGNCAECHGSDLKGTETAPALIESDLKHGDSVGDLIHSIANGHDGTGSPNFQNSLTDLEIKGLAIYVGERRLGQRFTDFRFDHEIVIPETPIKSEEHNFQLEAFAHNLDPMAFSIAPLPDGGFLLTEKERGLTIISPDGTQSELIKGTPQTGSSIDIMGILYGVGWMLDVALHPNYEENGWIYLHYTDLCPDDCVDTDPMSTSMNRLDRGRIKDGEWVDVETIWQATLDWYTSRADTGAGGRIAFDDSGHVYLSVGIRDNLGPQDLSNPSGKIHRVNDDGSVPADNPFVVAAANSGEEIPFTQQTIWTYGHRSPQGLEWNYNQKTAWNAEMGPRGGDEINELLPGENYGWPYFSLGLEYSGAAVERYKQKNIEFDKNSIQQTLVDITPSPAISSFAFYNSDKFASWKDNVLLGSLKGSSLFRLVFDGNKLVHRETLFKDLARIRDVEIGYDGLVYLLLENKAGSKIVRLVPSL